MGFLLRRKGHSMSKKLAEAWNGETFDRADWAKAAELAAGSTGKVHSVLNIGLASHSGVIEESCNFKTRGVWNNGVVEMLLLVEARNDASEVVVRQQSGECVLVMDAPDHRWGQELDLRDVANCKHPFDFTKAFTSRVSDSTERTKCEEVAIAPDAYPTVPAARLDVESP